MQNDVPTITGMNADEGSSSPSYGKIPMKDYKAQVERMYGDEAEEFLALYPFKSDEEAGLVQKESARDQSRVSTWMFAEYRAKTAKRRCISISLTELCHGLNTPTLEHFILVRYHMSSIT